MAPSSLFTICDVSCQPISNSFRNRTIQINDILSYWSLNQELVLKTGAMFLNLGFCEERDWRGMKEKRPAWRGEDGLPGGGKWSTWRWEDALPGGGKLVYLEVRRGPSSGGEKALLGVSTAAGSYLSTVNCCKHCPVGGTQAPLLFIPHLDYTPLNPSHWDTACPVTNWDINCASHEHFVELCLH